MQKNWYIIYTKEKCEKKVATTFTKRKIENFFPLKSNQHTQSIRKRKLQPEPLFDCYVFANIAESEIGRIREVDGVVNLVYWRGRPAVVREEEIEAIKEFTSDHQNIKLERTEVNPNEALRMIDGSRYSIDGNILSIKTSAIKMNLPSLGFTMIAEVSSENALNQEVSFGNKELLFQS
ncbi:MAG: transcription termination/antitermination NusG family protein [Ginsengibacter sp.]